MGFTRSHYVKMAIRKLFHKKTFYAVEAGITERVICYRNAGIFVENYVRKDFHFLPETARCASVLVPPSFMADAGNWQKTADGNTIQNDKTLSTPFSTLADMARNIVYASCNRKMRHVNGEQFDTRDGFAVIVAYSHCRKPHRGTSILPPIVMGQETYGVANRTGA